MVPLERRRPRPRVGMHQSRRRKRRRSRRREIVPQPNRPPERSWKSDRPGPVLVGHERIVHIELRHRRPERKEREK